MSAGFLQVVARNHRATDPAQRRIDAQNEVNAQRACLAFYEENATEVCEKLLAEGKFSELAERAAQFHRGRIKRAHKVMDAEFAQAETEWSLTRG